MVKDRGLMDFETPKLRKVRPGIQLWSFEAPNPVFLSLIIPDLISSYSQ